MNMTRQSSSARAEDNAYVSALLRQMNDLRMTHPGQMDMIDQADLDTAPRDHMVEMMRLAPTDSLRYFILGKFMLRVALAQITQRPFN